MASAAVNTAAALIGNSSAAQITPSARPASSFTGRPLPAAAHAPPSAPLSRRRALSVTARAGGGGGPNAPLQAPYQPFRVIQQEDEEQDGGYGSMTAQEQLQLLRDRQGLWHELARVVPLLLRSGYSPNAIDAETGLTGAEQNRWTVAAQVLESLRAAGLTADALAYFDVDGADVLYELRILSNAQRRQAAEYILANNNPAMEAKSVALLARAIKDHERKRGGADRDFFAPTPADCLAYLYYRQALETTSAADKESAVEKGLAVGPSNAAREKLLAVLSRAGDPASSSAAAGDLASSSMHAEITVVGVVDDDLRSAVVPVLGDLDALNAAQLRSSAPAAAAANALGVFSLPSSNSGTRWVALPQWPALTDSGPRLVALLCPTPAPVAAFVRVSKAQQAQPILLVVDLDDHDAHPGCCSLAADREGALSVVAGSQKLPGRDILGRVVLGIRRAPAASVVDGLDD